MAKTKINKSTVEKTASIEPLIDKYFWLVIPVLAIVYFISSRYSTGFYQDDEVAQYINMLDFWKNPWAILGNAPKPGYKILMVLPALISYDAVLLVNSLIASLTVFLTYKLIKLYGINYAFFGALLLAAQPAFFDISFRSYPEIFTGLLFAAFLILYRKEKYFLSGLIVGYIFTVRQEIVLFGLVLAIVFLKDKRYKEIAAIAIVPLLYNFLGYLMSGDILYVWSEMRNISAFEYKMEYPKFYHYVQVYIFIAGPVAFLLFLQGFFSFFADKNGMKEHFRKYFFLYVIFILVLAAHTATLVTKSNPGNWRYMLHAAPVCAVFCSMGLNCLADKKYSRTFYVIAGLSVFVTFVFLSKVSDGRVLTDVSDFTKVLFLIAVIAVAVLISKKSGVGYLNKVSVVLILVSILYIGIDFKPKVLSSENITVRNAAEYINTQNFRDRDFYANHPVFKFYSADYKHDPSKFRTLNSKNLSVAPKGSILAWETHYGYRPDSVWKLDTKLEDLQNNPDYRLINQFPASDRRFAMYFFEKLN
ncbi:MAG TPA: hypothetical protein VN514_06745 [Ignavibacteria bacterium]|nr:hypothetical protein [Ignavibacteria bacterium]